MLGIISQNKFRGVVCTYRDYTAWCTIIQANQHSHTIVVFIMTILVQAS